MSLSESELEEYFLLAVECAQIAGAIIKDAFLLPKVLNEKSNATDLVTETDKKCEEVVIDRIRARYPEHKFIAEESFDSSNGFLSLSLFSTKFDPLRRYLRYDITDELTWFIDPVDGTTNFVHGFPWTCISIGLTYGKSTVHIPSLSL